MPPNSDTFAFPKAQPAVKTTACPCGAAIQFTTCPKRYCVECSSKRKQASARVAMEKQRRKHGVAQVKGTMVTCARAGCGAEIVRNGIKRKYCSGCALEVAGERARETSVAVRQTPEGRSYRNQWRRLRTKSDPAWRVSASMRTLIYRALQGGKQGRSWKTFVPYSLAELMEHIERQFLRGMSWRNQGKWHIDHIIPISSFSFSSADDPEFQAAWALSNLRPLWAKENIQKNAQRLFLL